MKPTAIIVLGVVLVASHEVRAAPLPTSDEDGDGLTLAEEERGWIVTANRTGVVIDPISGLENKGDVFEVTSDPTLADTDGDGLTDGEERAAKTDPTNPDTDLDGLSDYDEIHRWGTSPTSVDSDGDARGFLSDRTIFPYAPLFDAAELQLVRGADGRWYAGPLATSPLLDDTDGDGVGDYEELLNPLRSPVVAETPTIDMRLSPDTLIEITINATTTDGTARKVAYTTSHSSSDTWSASGTVMIGNETEWYSRTEVKVGESASYAENEVTVGVSVEEEVTVGVKTTTNMALTFTGGFATNAAKTESTARAAEESNEVTIDSGTVRLSVDLTNTSAQTFTVGSFSVIAGTGHGVQGFKPLGTLTSESGPITLAPGESTTVQISNRRLEASRVMGLIGRPGALVLLPFNVDLLDEDGVDFDFRAEAIRSNTTLIQWAPAPEVGAIHYVSANVSRDGDGEPDGIRLGDALLAAGIGARRIEVPVEGAPDGIATLYDLGDAPSELHQGVAPSLGDPPYPSTGGPGPRLVRRGWFAYVVRYDPAALGDPIPADWTLTRLYPRDKATLIRSIDDDRDGVPAHLERIFGTFDDATDSDLDGLSDFFEIAEGWTVDVFGAPPELVFSSPVEPDADNDGLTDAEEQHYKTHPDKADTDGDGLSDFLEVQLEDAATNAGQRPERPQVSCLLVPTTPPPALVQRGVCDFEYSDNDTLSSRGRIENGCRCSAAVRIGVDTTPFDEDDWAFGSFLEQCGGPGQCTATNRLGGSVTFPCNRLMPGRARLIAKDDSGDWIAMDMPLGSERLDFGGASIGPEQVTAFSGAVVLNCGNYTPWSAPYWEGCPLRNKDGQPCSPAQLGVCLPILNSYHWVFGGNPNSPSSNPLDRGGHAFVPELIDPLLVSQIVTPAGGCSYFNHIPCWVADRAKDDYVITRRVVIDANDPQGDLVRVRLDIAKEGYRTEWVSDPPAAGQHHELPTGFAGTPGDFVVTAIDALGMQTTITCAAGGQ